MKLTREDVVRELHDAYANIAGDIRALLARGDTGGAGPTLLHLAQKYEGAAASVRLDAAQALEQAREGKAHP